MKHVARSNPDLAFGETVLRVLILVVNVDRHCKVSCPMGGVVEALYPQDASEIPV